MLSNTFVCIMGMGTVFVGLIVIVFLCMLVSAAVRFFEKGQKETSAVKASAPQAAPLPAAEKQKMIAGICAVIAEELGTDANNIKVLSFKKL